MMLWYVNRKTKEVKSYNVNDDDMTDILCKEFYKYERYIVTGFESKKSAEEWLIERELKYWCIDEVNC